MFAKWQDACVLLCAEIQICRFRTDFLELRFQARNIVHRGVCTILDRIFIFDIDISLYGLKCVAVHTYMRVQAAATSRNLYCIVFFYTLDQRVPLKRITSIYINKIYLYQ